jgi:hypothetical protein
MAAQCVPFWLPNLEIDSAALPQTTLPRSRQRSWSVRRWPDQLSELKDDLLADFWQQASIQIAYDLAECFIGKVRERARPLGLLVH